MQHHIHWARQIRQPSPYSSAHAPPNAIAFYRASKDLAHGKTHARARPVLPLAKKQSKVSRKMLSALLVNGLKVRMLQ